jgi:phosphoesterase RecJ-like protein
MEKELIEKFQKAVHENHKFVITTHVNADGDALGSELALAHFLRSKGKQIDIFNQEPFPRNFSFLSNDCHVQVFDPVLHTQMLEQSEVIFLIDNSTPARFLLMKEEILKSKAYKICIDHHLESDPIWDLNIIYEDACATAEIIYDLFLHLGEKIDLKLAEAFYAGIVTDTGNFRFSKTNVKTHRIVSELIEIGVVPQQIYNEIYERNSLEYVKLMGYALSNVTRVNDGKVAYITITHKMIDQCHAHAVDTSDIINPVLSISGVQMAILFKELSRGRSKASLRSKGQVDVNLIASEFGGGGHRNASGIVLNKPLEELRALLLQRIKKLV